MSVLVLRSNGSRLLTIILLVLMVRIGLPKRVKDLLGMLDLALVSIVVHAVHSLC